MSEETTNKKESIGDGYYVRIRNTYVMEAINTNYDTIAVTDPDGVEKWLFLPIKTILPQLLKDCRTS